MLDPAEFIEQRDYPGIDREIYEEYDFETGFMLTNADESMLLLFVLIFVVITVAILKRFSMELDEMISW